LALCARLLTKHHQMRIATKSINVTRHKM